MKKPAFVRFGPLSAPADSGSFNRLKHADALALAEGDVEFVEAIQSAQQVEVQPALFGKADERFHQARADSQRQAVQIDRQAVAVAHLDGGALARFEVEPNGSGELTGDTQICHAEILPLGARNLFRFTPRPLK